MNTNVKGGEVAEKQADNQDDGDSKDSRHPLFSPFSLMCMMPAGQAASQRPHPTHLSLSTTA